MRKNFVALAGILTIIMASATAAAGAGRLPKPRVTAAVQEKRPKLSFALQKLVGLHRSSDASPVSAENLVQVVIETDHIAAVKSHLQTLGGQFERAGSHLILARIPRSALESAASIPAVKIIRTPRAPVLFQTTSEGVNVTGAPQWHAAGRKGRGVRVAVLDLGFDGYGSLMGTELPEIPSARIRSFSGDITGGGEVHGTGVAEIVYDLAPEAELYLVNFSNEVELENAVDWLLDQRVDVINTSWGYPCGGPLNGTGTTNDLVKRAADAGILWVASAGNFAKRHWSGNFTDSNGDSWLNFSSNEEGNTVYMNSGDELRVCVEWDDWSNKDQDFDLYVWNSDGNVVASSEDSQNGPNSNDPIEFLEFSAGTTGDYYIGLSRYRGTRNPRVHLFAYPPGAECAIEAVAENAPAPKGVLGELRRFRDTVLAASPSGKALIESYYRHSPEVRRVLLRHPRLALEAAGILTASRDALRSTIDTQERSSYILTQTYASRVDRFLEELSAIAGPALREELETFRSRAKLSTAGGQTANGYLDWLLRPEPADAALDPQTFPDSGYMLHTVAETSLLPPADSPHAFTIGAIDWSNGAMEDFSSRGPTADGRRKPDIAAPDGVCTTTYADCGGNGFRGTSAAAPHAAGAAALVRQAYPLLTPTAIRSFLTGRAEDVAPPGPDNLSGAGRLTLGSLTEADVLAAPILLQPAGNGAPFQPTYAWSDVTGAASYRLMIAESRAALPSGTSAANCSSCFVTAVTQEPYFTPSVTLLPTRTYYWQVQAQAPGESGLWAQTSFTTQVPPEQTPPVRWSVRERSWAPPARNAVVLTHGWNSGVHSWVKEMAEKICGQIGGLATTDRPEPDTLSLICQANGWDVWIIDWSELAEFPLIPAEAYARAWLVGEKLARNLRAKSYAHVHFIAHSAGSNLIESATRRLKKGSAAPLVHQTFLDAYAPANLGGYYGRDADWADNYVDLRDIVDLHFGLDGTRLILSHAYNIDVTPAESPDCGMTCRHSRPYRLYGRSIHDTYLGNAGHATADPVASSNLGGIGYTLSGEAGKSLASLKTTRPKGTTCVASRPPCVAATAPATDEMRFVATGTSRRIANTGGAVTFTTGSASLFDSIRLGTVPPASSASPTAEAPATLLTTPTEQPSWIVVDVTTPKPVNLLRLEWRFGQAGEGVLRAFVNGSLVREIDQSDVSSASSEPEEIYIGGATGMLPAGTHRIVFRLDGFGTASSGIELSRVNLGTLASGTRRRTVRH